MWRASRRKRGARQPTARFNRGVPNLQEETGRTCAATRDEKTQGMPTRALQTDDLHLSQLRQLRAMLTAILPGNRFYGRKLAGVDPASLENLSDFRRLPFTTKAELAADRVENPPYGSNLSYPLTQYTRLHQTSGTSGKPLYWLDTPESWQEQVSIKKTLLKLAGLDSSDRFYFPFSFGPFLGFWLAFEAACRLGCFCMPGGGVSTITRLHQLIEHRATVVFCTPTYALHLAEVAREQGLDLPASAVRVLVVAGEPGGSIPETRALLEREWGARVIDHAGMTEVGPVSIECQQNPGGLHILETDYLAEIVDTTTSQPVHPGRPGELILTTLSRWGSPLLRYRTGDLVKADPRPCPCGNNLLRLEGGILGRTDDMIHVRGNNLYPSALEAVLRRFAEVAEYRIEVDRQGPQTSVRIEVEPVAGALGPLLANKIGQAIRDQFLFRAEVEAVAPGSLPRFELKAKRFVNKQSANSSH